MEYSPAPGVSHLESENRFFFEDGDLAVAFGEKLGELNAHQTPPDDDNAFAQGHVTVGQSAQAPRATQDAEPAASADHETVKNSERTGGVSGFLTGHKATEAIAIQDMGKVASRNGRILSTGPCRDDDRVGLLLPDVLGKQFPPQDDLDSQRVDLVFQPVEKSLVGFIDQRGKAQGAPELATFLVDRHPMATSRCDSCRFHACWAAAGNQDAHGSGRFLAQGFGEFGLVSRDGIDRATHRAVEEGLSHAGVAIDAGTDAFGSALLEFLGDRRIGKHRSPHGDYIGPAFANQLVARLGRDATDGDDRNRHPGLDARGKTCESVFGVNYGRLGEAGSQRVGIGAYMDGIGSRLFCEFGRASGIVNVDSVFFAKLDGIDATPNWEVATSGSFAGLDGLAEQARSILHRSSVAVFAKIPRGGQEFRKDVAVGPMNFHGVEARPLGASGRVCKIPNEFYQVVRGGFSDGGLRIACGCGHQTHFFPAQIQRATETLLVSRDRRH